MDHIAKKFRTIEGDDLRLEVYNASEESFGVSSVIVYADTEAVLVDAQFTLDDAEIIAERITMSGKKLKTIYISHNDPDFYFGLQVFKKYFPEVTAFAAPAVVEKIAATSQKKLEVWGERLGDRIVSNVILPQILKGDTIDLEGREIRIVGLTDFPQRTFVWIPTIKAVVGGINVFGDSFNLWMADSQTRESRNQWIDVLDRILSLDPETVVPAHGRNTDSFDPRSVHHTKEYIQYYEDILGKATNSEELINTITAKYPDLAFKMALQIGAKVNTGEMKW